ncbi:MAG: hypothetical protein ACYCZ0_03345 [Minisyncoccota bacterium]
MSDEIVLGNKTYVSSKRAAKACGYAQDYVGQLARGGVIDAQRIGGLWYVSMDSLEAYKRNAEGYTPKLPEVAQAPKELDTIVSFDGKDYVSAARAAKLTGYNPDYVGQLARSGKILSRQVGNRWYVEREGLLAHKTQKDSLLAVVQAESVGLQRPSDVFVPALQRVTHAHEQPYLTYIREDHHLMPVLLTKPEQSASVESVDAEPRSVPIRVVRRMSSTSRVRSMDKETSRRIRTSAMTINKATKAAAVLTVVIVVSYGFVSIKSESLYAFFRVDSTEMLVKDSMTAAASTAFERVGNIIEDIVSPEIRYFRSR